MQAPEPIKSAAKEPTGTRRYALRSRKQPEPLQEPYKVSCQLSMQAECHMALEAHMHGRRVIWHHLQA